MPLTTTAAIARGVLIWVPPESLRPNLWNPNSMDASLFDKEMESIRRFGMASPIVARETPEADIYEIVDGENRHKALIQLGHTQVPVWNVGPVPDATAKQLTLVLNEIKGSPEKQKLADLLTDLLKGESTESLLGILPYTPERFRELVDMPQIDWEEFEKAPSRVEDRWVERLYRLPPDTAEALDRAIARAKAVEGDAPEWVAIQRIASDFLGGE